MREKRILFSIFLSVLISLSFVAATWTEDLNNGLMGYWNLDDVYTDSTGNGLTLTANNSPVFASGIINNGSDTESSSSQFLSRHPDSLYPDLPFSINLWIKPESLTATRQDLINKAADAAGRSRYLIMITTDDKVFVEVRDSGNINRGVTSSTSLTAGTWTMITMVADGTNLYIYFNGSSEGTPDTLTTVWHAAEQPLAVGSTFTGAPNFFDGVIDELGIWSRALNSTEISDLYNSGNGITFSISSPLENATFKNVNVTNDLTVGNKLDATQGFFDFLGSSISKIIKGWFTELVVEKLNVTGETYLTNTPCLSGDVLTTNSDGLVSCTSVTEIKSGSVNVTENSCTSVTFNTNFSSTPVAVGNVQSGAEDNVVSIGSPSTTGFDLCLERVGAGGGSYTVYWTATNAGNS